MRRTLWVVFGLWIFASQASTVTVLNVQGAIGPAIADYLVRGMAKAVEMKADAIVIQMDTPGGLDKSMRDIIQSMLASEIPVIVYVAPSGARAASAGTFILYASHVAAMAPGTNIGAASPVSLTGGGMPGGSQKPQDSKQRSNEDKLKLKVMNDAIAYIRSIAQLKKRNITWVEKAVLEASTLTAEEALKQSVIEVVAKDLQDLIKQIHSQTIILNGQMHQFNLENPVIKVIEKDWRSKFLEVITDPSVAYILLMIGMYGLFFEFSNPGMVVPGVAGGIALILALYALQMLPITFAGLGLILLGVSFMVAEAFIPSFGALGIGGVIAFVAGSILLFDTTLPTFQIAWPLIATMAVLNLSFAIFVVGLAIQARRKKISTGAEELVGLVGVMIEDIENEGQAKVRGEIWHVVSLTPLKTQDKIKVIAVEGLKLKVEAHQE